MAIFFGHRMFICAKIGCDDMNAQQAGIIELLGISADNNTSNFEQYSECTRTHTTNKVETNVQRFGRNNAIIVGAGFRSA